jgi:hypothetical protein
MSILPLPPARRRAEPRAWDLYYDELVARSFPVLEQCCEATGEIGAARLAARWWIAVCGVLGAEAMCTAITELESE